MKQEDKAKAYDKVRKKIAIRFGSNVADEFFAEFEESKDEEIRKALLEMVHDTTGDELWIDYNVHKENALAWLEKQGEHANFRNKIQVGDKVTRNEDGVLVNLSQLKRVAKPSENQGEQEKDILEDAILDGNEDGFVLGSSWSDYAMDVYCVISEPKITRRLKQLLIERKKELVDEFSR